MVHPSCCRVRCYLYRVQSDAEMAVATLSFSGLLVLVAGQPLTRPPATFEVERFDSPAIEGMDAFEFDAPVTSNVKLPSDLGMAHLFALPNSLAIGVVSADSAQAEQSPERVTAVQGRAIELKAADGQYIGPSDAKYVMAKRFDNACPTCCEKFKAIRGARDRLGDDFTFVLLRIPLNSDCNPTIQDTGPHYQESCVLSKLAVDAGKLAAE